MRYSTEISDKSLEQLVREKSFAELNLHEKALVLTEVNEREYNNLRQLALSAEIYFQQEPLLLEPRPDTHAFLRKKLQEQKPLTLSQRLGKMMTYRIPAYQAVAAAVVLMLSFYLGTQPKFANGERVNPMVMVSDSALMDSAHQRGINLNEDTVMAGSRRDTF